MFSLSVRLIEKKTWTLLLHVQEDFQLFLEVKAPDLKGTRQILDIHTKGKPIDEDVDKDDIAKRIYEKKMTGADIALTVKEAFSHALERTGIYESMKKMPILL